jgi:hypothetical protein
LCAVFELASVCATGATVSAHAPKGAFLKHDPASSPESKLIGGEIQKNKEKVAKAKKGGGHGVAGRSQRHDRRVHRQAPEG